MTQLEKAATELIVEFDDLHSYLKPTALYPLITALRAALAQQAEPVVERINAGPVIAVVTASSDFSATVDWTLNPLPVGTQLYEAPQQTEPVVERINAGPVGYRYKYPDGDWRFSGGIKINGCDPIDSEPVYTHPAVKQQQAEPVRALTRYNELTADPETYSGHALERLRIFCSLAMRGQDWLDAEPFFDEAEQENLNWTRFKYVLQKHGLPPGHINDDLLATIDAALSRPR